MPTYARNDTRTVSELIEELLPIRASSDVDDELGRLVDNVALSSPQRRSASTGVARSATLAADDGFPSPDIWDVSLEPKSALMYQFAGLCWANGYEKGTKFWLDLFWTSIRIWLTGVNRPRPGEALPFALPSWYSPPVEWCAPVVLPNLWEPKFQLPTRFYPHWYVDGHGNQRHKDAAIIGARGDITFGGNCIITHGARIAVCPPRVNPKSRTLLKLGHYVLVGSDAVLEPTKISCDGVDVYLPGTIGNYTIISMGARVKVFEIGNYVSIGKGCVIGDRVVIHDGAFINHGAVVPSGTVVPKDCFWTGEKHCFATKFQQQYFPIRDKIRAFYASMFCDGEPRIEG